jgi:hypothetical protein
MKQITSKISEKPLVSLAIALIILFWMLVPLIAQKYYDYSAINVSFGITVFYFIGWKLYENREKFLNR